MLWLYDRDLSAIASLPEYDSIITTWKFGDHSTLDGRLPASAYDKVAAAYFATIADEDEVYLVEGFDLVTENGQRYTDLAPWRAASALLHTRTVVGTRRYSSKKHGYIAKDLMATLTGDRAIANLAFGTGDTLGTSIDKQISWGDMGAVVLDLLAAGHLGLRTRLDGTTIYVDLFAPAEISGAIGDAYGNTTSSKLSKQITDWRNYAIVLGEGEGSSRVRVDVDQTSGGERRELYVDASDLRKTVDGETLSDAAYEATLAQRGAERLAENRVVQFAEASLSAPLDCGAVAWFDAGAWSDWLMVTESVTTREGGTVRHSATIGEPPVTIRKILMKRSS